MPTVWIPSMMRKLTHGQDQVEVEGATLREVINNLEVAFPGIKARLCKNDRVRREVAVAVDGEISNQGLRRKVGAQSEIYFLPAVSGG